jgi:alkanesulfonate monooxygenase SsuD/methylene tetrahydromethanopterin reductase-like flavin-dependent oxidoreductase (luciferase family)
MVKCGIAIPQDFINKSAEMGLVRQFVRRAEALNFESLWVQEQIIGRAPVLDPVGLLTYASALTSRVRLGISMLTSIVYNPVQLAKTLSSLDQMCNGRLTVGISLGGITPAAVSGCADRRVRRFIEGLEVMKALWTQPAASFEGTFWNFKDVAMEPKPVQKPHPPVWFGARQPAALRRAAHYADGWMSPSSSLEDFRSRYGVVVQALEESGRDPATFAISKRVYIAVDEDETRAHQRLRAWFGVRYKDPAEADRVALWGSPEKCVERLREFIEAGAEHLLLNPVMDELEQMERIAGEIWPHL